MAGPDLSPGTRQRLECLFPSDLQTEATLRLTRDCGWDLPFCNGKSAIELERIRFAALKVSQGSLEGLRGAIELAQRDWRDLLVRAGFDCDVNAHARWLGTERRGEAGDKPRNAPAR